MKRVDLHIHTTASDSSMNPAAVVQLAYEDGLAAIAVTDHDTVDGFKMAASAAENIDMKVVPGIELSTKYYGSVHILGYFIDVDNPELQSELKGIVDDRDRRNEKVISLMRESGIQVSYDDMKERFGAVIGRPHFGTVIIENGLAETVTEAFDKYLGKGKPYWVPRKTVSMERCIELIIHAGGVPVLAHPFEYKYDVKTLADLIEVGIRYGIRGIECRHSKHSPGEMAYLERLAEDYDLLKTGGSDFHGAIKPTISLGTGDGILAVPYKWFEELEKERDRIRLHG